MRFPSHRPAALALFCLTTTAFAQATSAPQEDRGLDPARRSITDASFEGQSPGSTPDGPWRVLAGTGHLVAPLPLGDDDNGMPSHGLLWVEVGADGTNGATPPNNPGGFTTPSSGGAGVTQEIAYPAHQPILEFEAAFLRSEGADQPALNDWMSVDISDGNTTYNLYYADTFTPTPLLSSKYGTPMTEVETVSADLAVLFPGSAPDETRFTLTILTGNGRDAQHPSRGYVDHFRFRAPQPLADFAALPASGLAPLTVDFTDQSSGSIAARTWDFGDGGTSHAPNPRHTYAAPGNYTVTLSIVGGGGQDMETKTGVITVSGTPPDADFQATPTSGPAPLGVQFTDLSSGSILAWAWDFGDGSGSNARHPNHTYTATGTYTVSLTVSGPVGSDTETKTGFIVVGTPPPVADFQASPTSGAAPLNVNFTDLSSGTINAWAWDFGDGTGSNLTSPGHTYTQPGNYTVSLTVSGPGGSDTRTVVDLIQVAAAPPVAEFSASPTNGFAPLSVVFQNLSSGSITSLAWNFGDGQGSTASNPTHVYAQGGSYTVSLTASGPGGSDTNTKTNLITVTDAPPAAQFTATPTAGTAPLAVQFTDQSSGTITSRQWNFGDGALSSDVHPQHTYSTQGSYTVSLTVTGPGGSDSETKTDLILVDGPIPTARFSASPTVGTPPLQVNFSDESGGLLTSWFWTFGDGETSTERNPSHTYADVGSYEVSLSVAGPQGSDTLVRPGFITVDDSPPVAAFSAMPTSGTAPLSVGFSDQSSGPITNWSWNLGDGNTSFQRNPIHTYDQPGSYSVGLTVSGPGGIDSIQMQNLITVGDPPPVASFAGAPTVGVLPLTVNFFDTTTGNVSGWSWSFGDGNTSTLQSPSHVYTSVGTFAVTLTASGPGGSTTLTRNGFVTVGANTPVAAIDANPRKGVQPLDVSFQDDTVGNPTAWSWNFGDGNTSSLQNPDHTYTDAGIYDVSLTVTAAGGMDSVTLSDLILVAEEGARALPYGCGVNPTDSLRIITGQPTLGGTVVLAIDNPLGTQESGSIPLVAFSLAPNANFPCGALLPNAGMDGPGELLISLASSHRLRPNLRGPAWAGPGQPALISVRVPDDCSLIGTTVFAQGLLFDPSQSIDENRIGLADAVELRIGP